jgi:hypothetical protein
VHAPAYAGGRELRVESPASIVALAGSSVTFEAPGAGDGVTADVGGQALPVQRTGASWRAVLAVGDRPTLVRFRHASGERIVALEPRADSVPTVRAARCRSVTRSCASRAERCRCPRKCTRHRARERDVRIHRELRGRGELQVSVGHVRRASVQWRRERRAGGVARPRGARARAG